MFQYFVERPVFAIHYRYSAVPLCKHCYTENLRLTR